jgi:hypothetical protein
VFRWPGFDDVRGIFLGSVKRNRPKQKSTKTDGQNQMAMIHFMKIVVHHGGAGTPFIKFSVLRACG